MNLSCNGVAGRLQRVLCLFATYLLGLQHGAIYLPVCLATLERENPL